MKMSLVIPVIITSCDPVKAIQAVSLTLDE